MKLTNYRCTRTHILRGCILSHLSPQMRGISPLDLSPRPRVMIWLIAVVQIRYGGSTATWDWRRLSNATLGAPEITFTFIVIIAITRKLRMG